MPYIKKTFPLLFLCFLSLNISAQSPKLAAGPVAAFEYKYDDEYNGDFVSLEIILYRNGDVVLRKKSNEAQKTRYKTVTVISREEVEKLEKAITSIEAFTLEKLRGGDVYCNEGGAHLSLTWFVYMGPKTTQKIRSEFNCHTSSVKGNGVEVLVDAFAEWFRLSRP